METMLVISENAVRVKIIHDRAVDYVFQEFTRDACQRNRTVVFNVTNVGFFKEGCYECEFPFVWDNALIKGGLKEYHENIS